MISIANAASAEIISEDICKNNSFKNVYYLLSKSNYASASTFFQNIPPLEKQQFVSYSGERKRISTFYDYKDLVILESGKELVHKIDENLPEYFAEREKVSYIDKHLGQPETIDFEVKRYSKKSSPLDKHSLFGKIKRSERSLLIQSLASLNKHSPDLISETLKVKSTDQLRFITFYGKNYGLITISHFTIFNFGIPNTSLLIKIEKIDEDLNDLRTDEKKYVETYLCLVSNDFKSKFPDEKPLSWFGYEQYNKIAEHDFPGRRFFKKYPELYLIGQIICLSLIGFLIFRLFIGRYSRSTNYRCVIKKDKR